MLRGVGLLLGLLLAGCDGFQFSQLPAWTEIRAGLSSQPPSAAEQVLIARHRPQLFIAEGAAAPLNFYDDYIAHGYLQADGETIHKPTPLQLNAARHNPDAIFTHTPPAANTATQPVAYGGIHKATLSLSEDSAPLDLTFLSYHFVFRHSGLPAGISPMQKRLANLIASSSDWHQLDHYTAVFIVLHNARPIAYILQQHNYMRTYLIADPTAPIAIDVALSSNELYPHSSERVHHRAVGFINADNVDYLLHLRDSKSMDETTDITHGQEMVEYTLQYLPPNDAFYVFEGRLGARRHLPGRDGPPGAIYRTIPQLWHLPTAFYAFYWQEQDNEYASIFREITDPFNISPEVLSKLKHRLSQALPHE